MKLIIIQVKFVNDEFDLYSIYVFRKTQYIAFCIKK
jgi:hypothetical protein